MSSELRAEIEDEIVSTEREIARLRVPGRVTHRLEQALRERERLARHLAILDREDNLERRSA